MEEKFVSFDSAVMQVVLFVRVPELAPGQTFRTGLLSTRGKETVYDAADLYQPLIEEIAAYFGPPRCYSARFPAAVWSAVELFGQDQVHYDELLDPTFSLEQFQGGDWLKRLKGQSKKDPHWVFQSFFQNPMLREDPKVQTESVKLRAFILNEKYRRQRFRAVMTFDPLLSLGLRGWGYIKDSQLGLQSGHGALVRVSEDNGMIKMVTELVSLSPKPTKK